MATGPSFAVQSKIPCMKYSFLFLLVVGSTKLFAQDSNSVVVYKDPRIDMLVSKQIEINEVTTRNARRFVPGFRILVINTNNRSQAVAAKTKVYQKFPELQSYLMYQPPFYKLKVGNFKEREEAENYLTAIQKLFPSGVYVVRDTIELKPENE
jgi:hypothetical protein